MTFKSTCQDCGTRCTKCEDRDASCQGCGLREVTFQGQDTSRTFGKWLFSSQHKYFKTRCKGVKIQHALNGGEVGLPGTRYKLDGYCHETNTAYDFHGCVFHGCPRCFPEDREETKHPLTRQSMSELYALTMKKKSYIEGKGLKYVCMWEHEFREIYQNDPELRHYLQNLDITDRLDPRESFFAVGPMRVNCIIGRKRPNRSSTSTSLRYTPG